MFTGLIEQVGTIDRIERREDGLSIRIRCTLHPYQLGESIAVNGTCLTVKSFDESQFEADASLETIDKTNLNGLEEGDRVHLERALALGDRLGGHLVTGHVDGVGSLVATRSRRGLHPRKLRGPASTRSVSGAEGLDHRRRRQPDGEHRRRHAL